MKIRVHSWLIAPLLFWVGCAPRQSPVELGNRSGTMHVGSPGEPSELDPHIINAPPDFRIVPMLFEGLLKGHPATLEPQPAVADSWQLSEDALTYTFHLRDNARWSNGDRITSADFMFSWQRALTPALGSQYTFLFTDVVGADDFASGKIADFAQVGFRALDERTVTITLQQPTPYFLANLANNSIWSPVHRATLESAGKVTDRGNGWTKPATFVGNGPFVLTDWRPNEIIRLSKAPTYWDAHRVSLHHLVYHAFDGADTEERAFRAGQLHRAAQVPVAKLNHYRSQTDSPLVETDALIARFINLNTARAPFDDVRVRQAFALAIDRETIGRHIFFNTASPAYRIVPTGMPGYPQGRDITEDIATARTLMTEAGYPDGAGFPEVELSTEAGGSGNVTEALQARWQEVLGVHINIIASESRVHWSKLNQKDYDLAVGGWVADYPDATSYLDLWKTGSGWNFTNWNEKTYDDALKVAATQRTPAARAQALRHAEGILMQHMPIIPLVFVKETMLIHPSVQNFHPNAMDRPDYSTVTLKASP